MNPKVIMGSRILLGLIFTIFGVNGLAMIFAGGGFMPMPEPTPEMGAAMGGFFAAVYLMPVVKIFEVAAGILLLMNKRVNLAIVLLTPIVFNIFFLHLFLDQGGLPIGIACVAFLTVLVKDRWSAFKPILCS